MNMTQTQEYRKSDAVFAELKRFVGSAVADGLRADQCERGIMKQLLELGRELLDVAIARCGDGDQGPSVEDGGRKLKRLENKRDRRYVSIFGEHSFQQFVYAAREKQKIARRPVDEQLGLPAGKTLYCCWIGCSGSASKIPSRKAARRWSRCWTCPFPLARQST